MATHALSGATDMAAAMKALSRADTMVLYHHRPVQFADSAWLGEWLPTEPGTDNPAWATLSGVEVSNLTSTQIGNIDDKNGNYYEPFGPYTRTYPGKMADGTYADFHRWYAKFVTRMRERVAAGLKGLAESHRRLPRNQHGIDMVEGWLFEVFDHENDIEAINDGWTLTPPKLADIVGTDNWLARVLSKFKGVLVYTGAFNSVELDLGITA
jgi:hypothetical protein